MCFYTRIFTVNLLDIKHLFQFPKTNARMLKHNFCLVCSTIFFSTIVFAVLKKFEQTCCKKTGTYKF